MVNIGTSVLKRENRSSDRVIAILQRRGWDITGSIGDRVTYLENSGINITVIDGPMSTLIIPSGPIRGRIFGRDTQLFDQDSVIGAGRDTGNERRQATEATNRESRTVIN